jgi:ribonuclease H2 subunit B
MPPKQASKPGSQVVVAHSATPGFPQYTHIQLPDPKSGNLRTYYLTDANLLEATRYKQQHSSWLVNDDVISDGGLLMLTPVDPLLLLLPRLVQARKQSTEHAGVFCQIDQLLPHDEHPEILALLTRAAPQLHCICDVKQVRLHL